MAVNGENAAGNGLLPAHAEDILAAGADVITLGNHTFGKVQVANFLEENPYMLRPANFTAGRRAGGWAVYDCGRVRGGAEPHCGCEWFLTRKTPLPLPDRILKNADKPTFVLVDFHAQATSEKLAMRYYLDGRVSALWGTHTHVPTADAGVCEKGTGYITDLGMTGPARSVLGIRPEQSVEFFLGLVSRDGIRRRRGPVDCRGPCLHWIAALACASVWSA